MQGPKTEEDEEDSVSDVSHVKEKQKRGRKMTEPDKYYEESNINIQQWKKTLASEKTLTAIEKQRLRNKISALKSRMSKKSELSGLQDQIKQAKK